MDYVLTQISKCVKKVSTWNPKQEPDAEDFPYVDLSSVDKESKNIALESVELVSPADAPSRARQLIVTGDVLVSTVRPNLNGVALVTKELDGATASTGYCVLRPEPTKLDSRYLFYWVQSPNFVESMMMQATGANYPAVSDRIVKKSEIPLPPLSEQKRIAAILDKADALRRKRQQAIDLADQFLRSVFLDMFGDPATNPKKFPVGTIRDMVESANYGTSAKASETIGEYPVLRMGNITYQGGWDFTDLKYIDLTEKDLPKYLVYQGDLLFNRTNSRELVGKTAVYDQSEPMAFAGYLVRMRTNEKGNTHYISGYLNSAHGKSVLVGMCKSIVGMANINAQELQNIKILIPPVELQHQYKQIVTALKERMVKHHSSLNELNDLFASLSQSAFAGKL